MTIPINTAGIDPWADLSTTEWALETTLWLGRFPVWFLTDYITDEKNLDRFAKVVMNISSWGVALQVSDVFKSTLALSKFVQDFNKFRMLPETVCMLGSAAMGGLEFMSDQVARVAEGVFGFEARAAQEAGDLKVVDKSVYGLTQKWLGQVWEGKSDKALKEMNEVFNGIVNKIMAAPGQVQASMTAANYNRFVTTTVDAAYATLDRVHATLKLVNFVDGLSRIVVISTQFARSTELATSVFRLARFVNDFMERTTELWTGRKFETSQPLATQFHWRVVAMKAVASGAMIGFSAGVLIIMIKATLAAGAVLPFGLAGAFLAAAVQWMATMMPGAIAFITSTHTINVCAGVFLLATIFCDYYKKTVMVEVEKDIENAQQQAQNEAKKQQEASFEGMKARAEKLGEDMNRAGIPAEDHEDFHRGWRSFWRQEQEENPQEARA